MNRTTIVKKPEGPILYKMEKGANVGGWSMIVPATVLGIMVAVLALAGCVSQQDIAAEQRRADESDAYQQAVAFEAKWDRIGAAVGARPVDARTHAANVERMKQGLLHATEQGRTEGAAQAAADVAECERLAHVGWPWIGSTRLAAAYERGCLGLPY